MKKILILLGMILVISGCKRTSIRYSTYPSIRWDKNHIIVWESYHGPLPIYYTPHKVYYRPSIDYQRARIHKIHTKSTKPYVSRGPYVRPKKSSIILRHNRKIAEGNFIDKSRKAGKHSYHNRKRK